MYGLRYLSYYMCLPVLVIFCNIIICGLHLTKKVLSFMHQSIPAMPRHTPPPPPPPLRLQWGPLRLLQWGICPALLVSPRHGAFAIFALPGGQAFANPGTNPELLTRTRVSYQNITTQMILLEKQADWLICQGRQKIEEVCKGMFSISCMHFFIAYQARITERNR